MVVILAFKRVHKPHDHKKTRNSLSIIQMKRCSDEHVREPPGSNISDLSGGFMAPGSKSLASVDNISGSHGVGWGKFVGPQRLVVEVGRNLGV